jgi:hypothetical protein
VGERERVQALGEQRGYGQLVKVATPSYANEVGCVLPMGLVCVTGSVLFALEHSHTWYYDGIEAIGLLAGLGILAVLARPWVQRRPGGSEPRLYCFVDGVVVAVKSRLTAYRWDELRVEMKNWKRGSGDDYESGTQTTVFDDATGAVLAQFTGVEPGKAGAALLSRLHDSALDRAAESQAGGAET